MEAVEGCLCRILAGRLADTLDTGNNVIWNTPGSTPISQMGKIIVAQFASEMLSNQLRS